MKKTRLILGAMLAILCATFFQSCLNDDDAYSLDSFAVEIMTVEPLGDGVYYLMRDNGETLWPFASSDHSFKPKSRQRVQVNYTMLSDSIQGYDHGIKVNWVDEILTKVVAPNLGADNDSIYGTDPVELLGMETGGGYLDILFAANYGVSGTPHYINLIRQSEDGSSPYVLEFRHNAYDDQAVGSARGLVSFDLSSLPDTEGKTVKLQVKFHTFGGDIVKEIDYNSDSRIYSGSILRTMDDKTFPHNF